MRPDDWLFQIAMIICTFVLSGGVAYWIFISQVKAQDSRAEEARISDQFYRLGTINKDMVNALRPLGKWKKEEGAETLDALLEKTDQVMGDCLFELWHLEPAVEEPELARSCADLERTLHEFRLESWELQDYINSPFTLASFEEEDFDQRFQKLLGIKDVIDKKEINIRGQYRQWLGKPPLPYEDR